MKRLIQGLGLLFAFALLILAALPSTPAQAGGEDCLPYDPNALTIQQQGDFFILTDGRSSMVALASQDDANKALAMARRHTAHCFIGRNNDRSNRRDYIVDYWTGSSGLRVNSFAEDCISFNAGSLSVFQDGSDWVLTDGSSRMNIFASDVDAQSMINIISSQGYTQQCFIGRDNTRSDRKRFIVDYWKPSGRLVLVNPPLQINPGQIQLIPSDTPTPVLVLVNPPLQIDPGQIRLIPSDTPTFVPAAPPVGSAEDCLPYDPTSLYVVQEGDHWLLTNGQMRMNVLDNQADANAALGIAQQHTAQCYLGRGNNRPNRADYVFLYWKGDSGMGQPSSDSDCYQYNPDALYVVQDGDHWLLTDGLARMNIFDTQDEANMALSLVKPYNAQCWLGRSNNRADRINYIFPYWTRLPIGGGQPGQGQPPSGPSPTPVPPLPPAAVMSPEDCLPYNVAALYVVQDGDHWLLTDGMQRMVIYDNQADANLGLSVARQHTQMCFIGRGNTRPNRSDYISMYWK